MPYGSKLHILARGHSKDNAKSDPVTAAARHKHRLTQHPDTRGHHGICHRDQGHRKGEEKRDQRGENDVTAFDCCEQTNNVSRPRKAGLKRGPVRGFFFT